MRAAEDEHGWHGVPNKHGAAKGEREVAGKRGDPPFFRAHVQEEGRWQRRPSMCVSVSLTRSQFGARQETGRKLGRLTDA